MIANDKNSDVVNADPLFDLFSTGLFDPSSESIEEMNQYLDVLAESKSNGVNSE